MNVHRNARVSAAVVAVAMMPLVSSRGPAQRERPADAGPPTATGKVIAYEAGKSITVEVKKRGGLVEKREFTVVKDKTKVELLGRTKAIELGT